MDTLVKNKNLLMEEIQKCSEKPMSRERAEYLSICRGAYKAVCMAIKAEEPQEQLHDTGYYGYGIDRQTADTWTRSMENDDGTKGPHWTFDQAHQIMEQKKIDCDPVEFWVALNMMFSDYSAAAKKNNTSTVDFYADMAKAFLCDKDAKPDKLERYYQAIVKHE